MTELRTELPEEEEELTTADMATAGNRPIPQPEHWPEGTPPENAGAVPQEAAPAAAEPAARPVEAGETPPQEAPTAPLFAAPDAQALRSRWDDIQTGFVDNPRQAVEQADHLVAETIKNLAESFANERNQLEQQWSRGDHVSTEDLRIALQRYRSFFDRLLSF